MAKYHWLILDHSYFIVSFMTHTKLAEGRKSQLYAPFSRHNRCIQLLKVCFIPNDKTFSFLQHSSEEIYFPNIQNNSHLKPNFYFLKILQIKDICNCCVVGGVFFSLAIKIFDRNSFTEKKNIWWSIQANFKDKQLTYFQNIPVFQNIQHEI